MLEFHSQSEIKKIAYSTFMEYLFLMNLIDSENTHRSQELRSGELPKNQIEEVCQGLLRESDYLHNLLKEIQIQGSDLGLR
jgi:hypothetical protein